MLYDYGIKYGEENLTTLLAIKFGQTFVFLRRQDRNSLFRIERQADSRTFQGSVIEPRELQQILVLPFGLRVFSF